MSTSVYHTNLEYPAIHPSHFSSTQSHPCIHLAIHQFRFHSDKLADSTLLRRLKFLVVAYT
ncbi:hypothetical protein JAAARDRAFT_40590 [Jaapia argillacea MUCL 33604]|uniref:Uncharacterized protein n=1 Tax=Jaapia argillacea MUCL 33604 TaxID=933084 RepID=A0A067PNR2_9AGAM|nr:hypothetical protein JAAARDRAFT_40590 [Jaapia argillacea MUCL 33604]